MTAQPSDSNPSGAARAVVVGLGKSGFSVARYLLARGLEVTVTDSRAEPPEWPRLQGLARQLGREIEVRLGGFDASLLAGAQLLVVSPGVAMSGPFFDAARARGLNAIGDIELFARAVRAPVAGITGTNGKSTVTTLVARMAARAGLRVRSGGNLGEPALDLLDDSAELYVLELSSFQLESTESLSLAAAAVLNVSPDHLERYGDLESYAAAKARIYARCETAVVNLDDARVAAMVAASHRQLSFSLQAHAGADYTLMQREGGLWWLSRRGEPLLAVGAMRLKGAHNAANALAALALGEALSVPRPAMLAELSSFTGLAHRSQWVAQVRGVHYIDDSKGTNVGATLAAVAGLSGPLIVILGGQGKGQNFTPLRAAFAGKVRCALLIGRDARALGEALAGVCDCRYAESMEAAVELAAQLAEPGDTVLLSPACASLDMFRDYAHRGTVFAAAVQRLAA
jgi:UDP-N-acetylmuramoylalanine--D-glutamate ligase